MPKTKSVAVIGAGACGLSVAYYLSKKGIKVDVFESSNDIGGLGGSYSIEGKSTEKFVHHMFYSDKYFRGLVEELGLSKLLHFKKSKDGVFIDGKIFPFSSPIDLLKFKPISIYSRIRTGLVAAYLKKTKKYKKFENITAKDWIIKYFGLQSYAKVWEPLLVAKFGSYSEKISMSWFWARIHSRTAKLGYFSGGYEMFFRTLDSKIKENNGNIYLNSPVINIKSTKSNKIKITFKGKSKLYDSVVATIPPSVFEKITPEIKNTKYAKNLKLKEMISATTLNLVLHKSFMDYYWLNIMEKDFPFLVLIEHTNFVPRKPYKNKSVLYIGNYLNHSNQLFTNSAEQNFKIFFPYLKKINPKFSANWIESYSKFNALYAQPIVENNYYKSIPKQKTPIKNLYLCTMSQIYPFDRGTNYAIRDAKKISDLITNS